LEEQPCIQSEGDEVDIAALKREAALLFERHGLSGWRIEVSARLKRTLGLCDYSRRSIRVNAYYAENNSEAVVLNTLRHEVAHALTPGHGHDSTWVAAAVRLGCRTEPPCDRDILLPAGRFQAVCPSCRRTYHKHRLRAAQSGRYYCRSCGKERGVLAFAESRALLTLTCCTEAQG
jgi:predicted SprT family Zn-dependent metalloprotease